MFGRLQLPLLVQKLTFLVSVASLILGVASTYVDYASCYSSDDGHQVVPADVPEEMAETSGTPDLEDDLDGLIERGSLLPFHPATLRDVLGLAPRDLLPPSPFLDPLLRPPCLA